MALFGACKVIECRYWVLMQRWGTFFQVVAALGLPLFEHLAQHRTSPGGCPRPVHGGLVCGLPVGSRPGSAYNLAISAGPHDFNIAVSDADGQVQVFAAGALSGGQDLFCLLGGV